MYGYFQGSDITYSCLTEHACNETITIDNPIFTEHPERVDTSDWVLNNKTIAHIVEYDCGCKRENNIFKRDKSCNLIVAAHL